MLKALVKVKLASIVPKWIRSSDVNSLAGYGSTNAQPRSNNKQECANIQQVENIIQQYWLKYSSPEDVSLSSKYLVF